MKIRYFAWIRERIGKKEDNYSGNANTIKELLDEFIVMDEGYSAAFADINILRFAIDEEMVEIDASLKNATELAIFPPMTGG